MLATPYSLTANIQIPEATSELFRSHVVSAAVSERRKRRKVTLTEAWAIVGGIFTHAQKQRESRRDRESREFFSTMLGE